MANCQKCNKIFSLITIRNVRHSNPLGNGNLCSACYQPYLLVLETYTSNVDNADTDPKAAAWTALCCLLTAQKINLVHTFIAALCGIVETRHSWEVCRQKSIELVQHALKMLEPDANGRVFLQALLNSAEVLVKTPGRQISVQKYGSVFGDDIAAIEYEAIKRSGVCMDELNAFVTSLPGREWLIPQ
jgi:hypothetical protein